MSDFNLRHLVRDVLENSPLTDPHALADEVLGRIDDCDLRPALGQVLASMVREEIRASRNGGLPPAPSRPTTTSPPPASGPRLTLNTQRDAPQMQVMAERSGGYSVSLPMPRQGAKAARSAKVVAIREAGPKWLGERLNTGADAGDWKRIGDCSFSDLMFAVGQRREQVARTSAAADRLERLAEQVRVHGVDWVRDLPASVLAEVGGAAA